MDIVSRIKGPLIIYMFALSLRVVRLVNSYSSFAALLLDSEVLATSISLAQPFRPSSASFDGGRVVGTRQRQRLVPLSFISYRQGAYTDRS